jgi:hypothetical protein
MVSFFSKPEVPTTDSVIPDNPTGDHQFSCLSYLKSPNSPPILFQLYPVIPPTGSS